MKTIKELIENRSEPTKSEFKNRRAELIFRLGQGINKERVARKLKPWSLAYLAVRTNMNPFLGKSDAEFEYLIKQCEEKGNYSKYNFMTQAKNVPK